MATVPIRNNQEEGNQVEMAAPKRLTAHEIFESVTQNAREELERSSRALAFSGVAGGITMGLTGLGVALARATLGSSPATDFISMLFYPLGFIAVIIGRAQLFTENTLYPVALILRERRHVLNTLRLWAVVFISNVVGAAIFAALAVRTGALMPEFRHQLIQLGAHMTASPAAQVFWTGVVGGWLIALVAWMVSASQWTMGQILVIWLLTFVVGLGHFAHCIASTGEILSAVFAGAVPLTAYVRWIVPATLGNIVGGVFIVTLLNYGQVSAGEATG
jgi:formate/nitrite transporter FocA (FNT family)